MKALSTTIRKRRQVASQRHPKPGDKTILPFSVHSLRREHGTVYIERSYVAARVVYTPGERVRRHRERVRAIRLEAKRLIGEIGVPKGAPEIALVTIVPDRHGNVNLDAAEKITVPAATQVQLGRLRVLVAFGAALSAEEAEKTARRLKVPRQCLLAVSDDCPTVVEAAVSLLETTWRAAA